MPSDKKPQKGQREGGGMPLLLPKAKASRMIPLRPNPDLSMEGYYDTQMERFPGMMEALGKK